MKPPKKIEVYGRVYDLEPNTEMAAAADVAGMHLPSSDKVVYDADAATHEMRDTILHELLHTLWYGSALDKRYTGEQEEEIVWTLTPLLLMLLRRNPELTQFLLR